MSIFRAKIVGFFLNLVLNYGQQYRMSKFKADLMIIVYYKETTFWYS